MNSILERIRNANKIASENAQKALENASQEATKCPPGWTKAAFNTCLIGNTNRGITDTNANFSGYSDAKLNQWACEHGVYWPEVGNTITNGWWVNGKCTNDKVDIIKYAKCPRYGHIVKLSHNGSYTHWKCGKPIVDANQFEFAPGDPNALYAQMMQNNDFKIIFEDSNISCSQKGRTLGVVSGFESWPDGQQARGTCVADVSHVDCTFPDFVCKIPENERKKKDKYQKTVMGQEDDKEFKDFLFTKNNFKIRIHNEKIQNSTKLHFVISKDNGFKIPEFGMTNELSLTTDHKEYKFKEYLNPTDLHLFKT